MDACTPTIQSNRRYTLSLGNPSSSIVHNKHAYSLFQRDIQSLSSKDNHSTNVLVINIQKKRQSETQQTNVELAPNYNIMLVYYMSFPNVNSLRDFI